MSGARGKRVLALLVLVAVAGGCTPDLGAPPSLIRQNRMLAIKGEPAEAAPGAAVMFTMLAASPDGTLFATPPMSDDMKPPIDWSFCIAPKPLSENNAVSIDCLDGPTAENPTPLSDLASGTAIASGMLPAAGCQLFGPEPPPMKPDQPPLRARDPDVTGGYFQPLRVTWILGAPGGGDIVDVALERITCNLANAPLDIVTDFHARYHANANPRLGGVTARIGEGDQQPLAPDGQAPSGNELASVPPGAALTLRALFGDDSAECYTVFDITRRKLVDHTEALRVSWFATGGSFEHDRTGLAAPEDCTPGDGDACNCPCRCAGPQDGGQPANACSCRAGAAFAENVWTAPAAPDTLVHLWAVLRDTRGGVDFASYAIPVKP